VPRSTGERALDRGPPIRRYLRPRVLPKGIETQIQGDEVRVTSKSRDDLQAVIQFLERAEADHDIDAALQFVNYR